MSESTKRRDFSTETVTFPVVVLVKKLAAIAATQQEMAEFTGIPLRTLERALSSKAQGPLVEAYREGLEERRSSLLRMMWNAARGGNVIMQIWLSKNLLGWRDRAELDIRSAVKQLAAMTDEELEQLDRAGRGERGEDDGNEPAH